MKYPLIEKMRLKVDRVETIQERGTVYQSHSYRTVVDAHDLESALEKATVVYGQNGLSWDYDKISADTHTARLICIEEIKKEVVKLKVHIYRDENGNFASEVADEQVGLMGGYKYVETVSIQLKELP